MAHFGNTYIYYTTDFDRKQDGIPHKAATHSLCSVAGAEARSPRWQARSMVF
jgi:hypothetical protein